MSKPHLARLKPPNLLTRASRNRVKITAEESAALTRRKLAHAMLATVCIVMMVGWLGEGNQAGASKATRQDADTFSI